MCYTFLEGKYTRMITIQILGLDQYVVGHYSKEATPNIANLLETSEEEVNFYSPYESLLFHNGVEQTSWNTLVYVKLPKKYEVFEHALADYLIETLKDFTINVEINFEYILEGKTYEYINHDYPRFLTGDNLHEEETSDNDGNDHECSCGHHHDDCDCDDCDCDPRDRADLDYNDPEQIYLGDAFEGHEEDLEKLDEALKLNK